MSITEANDQSGDGNDRDGKKIDDKEATLPLGISDGEIVVRVGDLKKELQEAIAAARARDKARISGAPASDSDGQP